MTYALRDSTGTDVAFNVLDYANYADLQTSFDSLQSTFGELDFQRKDTVYDVEVVTSDFLIEQIDDAFTAWREKPWAKGMSFETF